MEKGSLGAKYMDRTNPMDKQLQVMVDLRGFEAAPPTAQFFGNAGREHIEKYGTRPEAFAKIGHKNHKHSVNNPYSQFQQEYSLDDIKNAPMVFDPLTKLQCCPTSDGAGAAILASEDFVKKHGLQKQAVEIAGMAMTSDFSSTFDAKSCIKLIGQDMTRAAAEKVYEQSGLGPENVQVIELHDCFSTNELVTYEGLGLCPREGRRSDRVRRRHVRRQVGRESVGRLISKGHPLGATGSRSARSSTGSFAGVADTAAVAGREGGAPSPTFGSQASARRVDDRKADVA
jgi:sterol carrier protein 2